MTIALAILALVLQSPEEAAARKCDSQIPWITDGVEPANTEFTGALLSTPTAPCTVTPLITE